MPVGIPISRARAELADLIERLDRSANSAPWSVCGPPWGNGTAVFTGTGDPHGQRLICDCDELGACYDDTDPLYQADDTDNARLIVALRNGLPTILAALREPEREPDEAAVERVGKMLFELDWDELIDAGDCLKVAARLLRAEREG